MKKNVKIILILILLGFISGVGIGLYKFYKPPKDLTKLKSDLVIEATQLLNEFETDEETSNAKYLDKVIEVSGIIGEISTNENGNIVLILKEDMSLTGISCTLTENESKKSGQLHMGDMVKIKGLCTGILLDVVLIKCVVI